MMGLRPSFDSDTNISFNGPLFASDLFHLGLHGEL